MNAHIEQIHGPVEIVPALLESRRMGVDPEYCGEPMAFALRLCDLLDLGHLLPDTLQITERFKRILASILR